MGFFFCIVVFFFSNESERHWMGEGVSGMSESPEIQGLNSLLPLSLFFSAQQISLWNTSSICKKIRKLFLTHIALSVTVFLSKKEEKSLRFEVGTVESPTSDCG